MSVTRAYIVLHVCLCVCLCVCVCAYKLLQEALLYLAPGLICLSMSILDMCMNVYHMFIHRSTRVCVCERERERERERECVCVGMCKLLQETSLNLGSV